MARWYEEDAQRLVGRTPPVRLRGISAASGAPAAGQREALHREGRDRDRIGVAVVEAAEPEASIRPGPVLAEPTGGGSGIAPARVLWEA